MSFLSWQYAFFLPLVVTCYWCMGLRARMTLLLAASYLFYAMWDVRFIALLMASTCVDFYCGRAIAGHRPGVVKVVLTSLLPLLWLLGCLFFPQVAGGIADGMLEVAGGFALVFSAAFFLIWQMPEQRRRRAFLLVSIGSNLSLLVIFKYFGFFAGALMDLLRLAGWEPGWVLPEVILPVALSFYTFQSIAYAVDVFAGKARPAEDLLTFGAYLAFFPQLVAGPIERPAHLLPQFQSAARWDWGHIHIGCRLLLVGAFKKLFVADSCAVVANHVFTPGAVLNAPWAVLGVLAFAFQIYGDFSGYTDLARGSAKVLGIDLSRNFHLPYAARGPSDFWQRWHITLSRWFRDYVYIPLGGNRGSPAATMRNLWITMLLAGLWHGASWTFILWGAYHAALLTLYRMVPWLRRMEADPAEKGLRRHGAVAIMFVLTLGGWAVFRAQGLQGLGAWLAALGHFQATLPWLKPAAWLLIHIAPLLLLQFLTRRRGDEASLDHLGWPARGVIFILLFLLAASASSEDQDFIYFQF